MFSLFRFYTDSLYFFCSHSYFLTARRPSAQNITIAQMTNAMPNVVYHRPGGTSCVIESADSLNPPNWVTINTGSLDVSNNLAFQDLQPLASNRFYRATDLIGVWTTPATVYGLKNNPTTVYLSGVDTVTNGPLTFTITKLPARGMLFQTGAQQPITNVPTVVLSTSNTVTFLALTNDIGLPYTSFEYTVTSVARGVTSQPGRVTVEIASSDSPPFPTLVKPVTDENTPLYIKLAYNPGNPPSPVSVYILDTVDVGDFYQVGPDNVTIGAHIGGEVQVSNPSGLVCYVPPNDQYGSPLATFSYFCVDGFQHVSPTDIVPIDVNHVNQAPIATPEITTGFTDAYITGVSLNTYDPDGPDNFTVCFTHIDDSIQIYLNVPIAPENLVTNGMCVSNQTFFRVVPTLPSGPGFPVITNYGSPFGTYSYYASDGQLTSQVVTDTVDIVVRGFYPDPSASPGVVPITNQNPVTITLEANDYLNGGDSSQLLFQIQTLPQYGTLSLPGGFVPKFTPFTLPLSNPSNGWPVVYTLNSNYFNPQTNSDSFAFTLSDATGLEYPLPLVVQLPLPTHAYPVVTPPPTNIGVIYPNPFSPPNPITVTLEAVDPNPGDNTTNLIFTLTNLTTLGKLSLPNGTMITNVPFVLPYSISPTNGWPVVYKGPNPSVHSTNLIDSFGFKVVDQQGDPYPFPLNVTFSIPSPGL